MNSNETKSDSSSYTPASVEGQEHERLTLVSSAQLQSIFGADVDVFVTGLSADPSTRTLFLSFYSVGAPRRGGVRTLAIDYIGGRSLDSTPPLTTSDAYICPAGRGYGVCFERATNTLLACTFEDLDGRLGHWLVSLSRSTSTGVEQQQWTGEQWMELEPICGDVRFAELGGGRVMFSESYSTRLQVLLISSDHQILEGRIVRVNDQFSTFDARNIGNETLVALTSKNGTHVRLCRLVADRTLQELSSIELEDTWKVLWFGERLLLAHFDSLTQFDSVLEVMQSGNALTRGPVLLNERNIIKWCSAGNSISIIDYVTQELFLYFMK